MAFDITPRGHIFRVVVGSQIVIPPTIPPYNNTPVTRTHNFGFDTICQTISYAISPQNQLMMRKTHSNFLWQLTLHHTGLFLEWLQRVKLQFSQQLHCKCKSIHSKVAKNLKYYFIYFNTTLYNTPHNNFFFITLSIFTTSLLFFNYFLILCVSSSLFLCSLFSQTKTTHCKTISHHHPIRKPNPPPKPPPPPSPLEIPIHHLPSENPSHHPPSTTINQNPPTLQPPLQTPSQNQIDNHHKIPHFKPIPKSKSTNYQAHNKKEKDFQPQQKKIKKKKRKKKKKKGKRETTSVQR